MLNVRFLFLLALSSLAAEPQRAPSDRWVEAKTVYPRGLIGREERSSEFSGLRAHVNAGLLKVSCPQNTNQSDSAAALYWSVGKESHWPTRHWQHAEMKPKGSFWESAIPVETIEQTNVYFVVVTNKKGDRSISPMRACIGERLGLQQPTQAFWPYLEGFEEGADQWFAVSTNGCKSIVRADSDARTGRRALVVQADKKFTLASTVLQGEQARRQLASGVRLWVKTRHGAGTITCAAHANAYATNEVIAGWGRVFHPQRDWQPIMLPFNELQSVSMPEVDLFTITFQAERETEFLIDDIELTGPWERSY